MKQSLFANSYSTIHELNLLKHAPALSGLHFKKSKGKVDGVAPTLNGTIGHSFCSQLRSGLILVHSLHGNK